MAIRILLVDDHRIVRDGLRALLHSQPDFELVAEAEEGRTAVTLAAELSPDIVVMDISMPHLNGVDATLAIMSRCPGASVVILSALADQTLAVDAMKAGAKALLPKGAAFEELALAIRTAIAGKVYLSPNLHEHIVQAIQCATSNGGSHLFHVLTSRQRQVLQLMAEGNATKQIAHHLGLSVKTIETYRHQIMEKLHLESIAELTKYAVREGLTAL